MASIYKRDSDSGKKRSCWYIGYRDHLGKRRTKKGFTDKAATERLAHQLEEEARLIKAGLKEIPDSRTEESLEKQIEAFRLSLVNRDLTTDRVKELTAKIQRMVKDCDFSQAQQVNGARLEEVLAGWRSGGMSRQTSNHYLKAMKQFCTWMNKTKRLVGNPVADLKPLNVRTDRRHDRRPLTQEELTRLVEAAETGKKVESIAGPDRAMMYMLAAWTGYRKGEIGSLTYSSFELASEPAVVRVQAAYSKRRKDDSMVLHPTVIQRVTEWLAQKKVSLDEPLFPVSGKVPGGTDRKTSKMMRVDLEAARIQWIEEADSEEEAERRKNSDFLKYKNSDGRYADFHANRHTFITNLAKAGVSPKTAQVLARHSDIRLTMNTYTHADTAEQEAAVGMLPEFQEYSGSARETQNGSNVQNVSGTGNQGETQQEGEDLPQPPDVAEGCVESQPLSDNGESTPTWVRTRNLRFRRPVLYPVEL